MKRAIIIHGSADKEEYYSDEYPSLSNSHWIPWLQKQLIMNGYLAQTPEMPLPLPFKYNFRTWKNEIDRYELGNNSILIGFSLGGGFLVRYLSGNKDTNLSRPLA
jgi:predicted alpha/beta hydrolase family esterase